MCDMHFIISSNNKIKCNNCKQFLISMLNYQMLIKYSNKSKFEK